MFADLIMETERDGEIKTTDILDIVKRAGTCIPVQKILMKLPRSKRPKPADVPAFPPLPGYPDLGMYVK